MAEPLRLGDDFQARGGTIKGQSNTVPGVRTQEKGTAGKKAEERESTTGVSKGIFNLQGMMDDFYGFNVKEQDAEGRAIKRTFQANMVQSAFDTQMAKDMAFANQEIASSAMNQAADLEMRNQAQVMKDEFDYGMQKMGAEFDYQNRFATDEATRQTYLMSHAGNIQQNQTSLEGEENRMGMVTTGEQERLNLDKSGQIQKGLQALQGEQAKEQIKAGGDEAVRQIGAQGDQDIRRGEQQGKQAIEQIGASGEQALKQIGASGDVSFKLGEQSGKQALEQLEAGGRNRISEIQETGKEERLNLNEQQRMTAKDRANQSSYARGLAGKF